MTDQEREAFLQRLYQEYYQILLNKSFSEFNYLPEYRHLAEDCVQDTFIRAMKEADTLSGHKAPLLWLMVTCSHIAASERRKLRRRNEIVNTVPEQDVELADPQDAIADWITEQDLLSKKELLLSGLTDQERSVYKAVYEDHLTAAETASLIHTTEGGVYSALRRIRKKILQIFTSLFLLLAHLVGM